MAAAEARTAAEEAVTAAVVVEARAAVVAEARAVVEEAVRAAVVAEARTVVEEAVLAAVVVEARTAVVYTDTKFQTYRARPKNWGGLFLFRYLRDSFLLTTLQWHRCLAE
jgi:hypothetical protein